MSALDKLMNKEFLELTAIEKTITFVATYKNGKDTSEAAAAELAAIRERVQVLEENLHQQTHQTVGAEMERNELRDKVGKLEWVVKRLEYIEDGDLYLCPICRGEKPTHYEDCELAAALRGEA